MLDAKIFSKNYCMNFKKSKLLLKSYTWLYVMFIPLHWKRVNKKRQFEENHFLSNYFQITSEIQLIISSIFPKHSRYLVSLYCWLLMFVKKSFVIIRACAVKFLLYKFIQYLEVTAVVRHIKCLALPNPVVRCLKLIEFSLIFSMGSSVIERNAVV